jgi:hypothetical protein
MVTLGIDKIIASTEEFTVNANHSLKVQPMPYAPNDENQIEEPTLFNEQKGIKAWANTSSFQLSINPKGLSLQLNPSKCLHSYHLTNDDKVIQEVFNEVRKQVQELGVLLPPDNELRLTRFDMAKNNQMSYPVRYYGPVFESLRGKRMQNKAYPHSYYFFNKSREITFYDKTEEVTQQSQKGKDNHTPIQVEPRLMRAELRALNIETVGRVYRCNDLATMIKAGSDYREDKFKHTVSTQIFAEGNQQDQLQIFAIDYDRELEILKFYKSSYRRNSVEKWVSSTGIESLIEKFRSLDQIRGLLLDAGYGRQYVYDVIKDLNDRMQMRSFYMTKNERDNHNQKNLTKLYNEIYTKFAC